MGRVMSHKEELKELENIMDMHLPSILELVEMYLPYKDVKIYENRMYRIYDTIAKIEDTITKLEKDYDSRNRKQTL
jgi:primosomal protein N''